MDVKVKNILWFNKGSSDKIWGLVDRGPDTFSFWCKRGKTINVSKFNGGAMDMVMKKESKGYRRITDDKLLGIDPTFRDRLIDAIVLGLLKG